MESERNQKMSKQQQQEDQTSLDLYTEQKHIDENSNDLNEDGRPLMDSVKFYLTQGMKLCKLNIAGEHEGFGPSTERAKLPLWSHLAELFYYCVLPQLVIAIYWQHDYNMLTHELRNLQEEHNRTALTNYSSGSAPTTANRLQIVQASLDVTISRLQLLGHPFYEAGFAVEPPGALSTLVIFSAYMEPRLLVAVTRPFKFSVARLLLDTKRELALVTRRQIDWLTSEFIDSSENFLRASREKLQVGSGKEVSQALAALKYLGPTRTLELAHVRTVRALRHMDARGHLLPKNRRLEWTLRLAQFWNFGFLFMVVGGMAVHVVIFILLPLSGWLPFRIHFGPRYLITHAAFACYHLLGFSTAGILAVTVALTAIDLIKFVLDLQEAVTSLTRDTIRSRVGHHRGATSHHHHQHHSLSPIAPTPALEQSSHLNERLLCLLVHYKLFTCQLDASKQIMGFIAAHLAILMLLVPVVSRVYMAYMVAEVRYTLIIGSLLIVAFCDVLLMPYCYLHARCIKLLKSRLFLLARIDGAPQQLYDKHTVSLLRRELNNPEIAVSDFATNAFFLQLTYAGFLGIHFWCGLLLAPLLFKDTAQFGKGGANIFSETLSIF